MQIENRPSQNQCDYCYKCNLPCLHNTNLASRSIPKISTSDTKTGCFHDEAFDELYIKHQKRVYSMIFRIIRNKEDAEDLTQEVFVRAYLNFDRLDSRAPIFAWLCKIATNLCIDAARKNMNIQLISLDGCYVAERLEERCNSLIKTINLGQNLEMEEMMILIHKAMDTLPPHYCQVLVLRGCEELPSKEVAKIMGISVSMVDTLLHRSRKKIRRIYKQLC